jgi:hypothetical protein
VPLRHHYACPPAKSNRSVLWKTAAKVLMLAATTGTDGLARLVTRTRPRAAAHMGRHPTHVRTRPPAMAPTAVRVWSCLLDVLRVYLLNKAYVRGAATALLVCVHERACVCVCVCACVRVCA